jgi:hypothetical protein
VSRWDVVNRALLVGINAYPGQPLLGCVNDVNDVANFLVDRCGFDSSDVRLVVDDRATTNNIKERLAWLSKGTGIGDRILFIAVVELSSLSKMQTVR